MHRGREASQDYAKAPDLVMLGEPVGMRTCVRDGENQGPRRRDSGPAQECVDDLTKNPDISPIPQSFQPDTGRNDGRCGEAVRFLAISSCFACSPCDALQAS